MDNLEMSGSLKHMSLHQGKKPEYLEETPEVQGEPTYISEKEIETLTLEVWTNLSNHQTTVHSLFSVILIINLKKTIISIYGCDDFNSYTK